MDERIPPRYGAKSEHKRNPTKRHIEDRLKALRVKLARWKSKRAKPAIHPKLHKIWDRVIAKTEQEIAECETALNGY